MWILQTVTLEFDFILKFMFKFNSTLKISWQSKSVASLINSILATSFVNGHVIFAIFVCLPYLKHSCEVNPIWIWWVQDTLLTWWHWRLVQCLRIQIGRLLCIVLMRMRRKRIAPFWDLLFVVVILGVWWERYPLGKLSNYNFDQLEVLMHVGYELW